VNETRDDAREEYWTQRAAVPVCVVVLTFQVLGLTHEYVSRFWFGIFG
jgi:hypothetical protein